MPSRYRLQGEPAINNRAEPCTHGSVTVAGINRGNPDGRLCTVNQNIAAAAGAVGGAFAGNAIQKNTTGPSYNVYVRMDDGRTTVVTQKDLDGVREGAYVRVYNGRAQLR